MAAILGLDAKTYFAGTIASPVFTDEVGQPYSELEGIGLAASTAWTSALEQHRMFHGDCDTYSLRKLIDVELPMLLHHCESHLWRSTADQRTWGRCRLA